MEYSLLFYQEIVPKASKLSFLDDDDPTVLFKVDGERTSVVVDQNSKQATSEKPLEQVIKNVLTNIFNIEIPAHRLSLSPQVKVNHPPVSVFECGGPSDASALKVQNVDSSDQQEMGEFDILKEPRNVDNWNEYFNDDQPAFNLFIPEDGIKKSITLPSITSLNNQQTLIPSFKREL